jgi:hypothetical protein
MFKGMFFGFSISVLQLLNDFGLNSKVVSEVNYAVNIASGERLGADEFCQLAAYVTCWVEEAITVDVLDCHSDGGHFISPVIKL